MNVDLEICNELHLMKIQNDNSFIWVEKNMLDRETNLRQDKQA